MIGSRELYHDAWRQRLHRLGGVLLTCAVLALACEPAVPEGTAPAAAPRRIVSLGPELGRILVELGLGPSVVGTDSESLAIAELAHALDLGSADAPSAALAGTLRPDLVLVLAGPSDPSADFSRALESAGIPAYLLDPGTANEVIDAIHRIGRLVGRELRASAVAGRLARDTSATATLRDGRTRLSAAWVIGNDPLVVVGGTGLLHELLELAGAENAFHTPAGERLVVTKAELAARGPDVVLGSRGIPPALAGARSVVIDASLARLPALDIPARVRALHTALYSAGRDVRRSP